MIRYDKDTVIQVPISQVEVENGISAGVQWKSMGPGLVPIYEEHRARLERGYSLEAWYAMEEMERAMVVAIRRITIQQDNLQADAEIKASKKNAAKGAKTRK